MEFWNAFYKEYNYNDISTGVVRSVAVKLLCNELKLGRISDPYQRVSKNKEEKSHPRERKYSNVGSIFVGAVDEEGKILCNISTCDQYILINLILILG